MNCVFCKKEIAEGSAFCNWCGKKQVRDFHRKQNGSGTVYKRGNTYTVKVVKYGNGLKREITKGGFKTKKEAYEYAVTLRDELNLKRTEAISFCDLWEKLKTTERYQKLSEDKKDTWKYAYQKCAPLYQCTDVRELRFENFQKLVEGLTYYPARDVKTVLTAMMRLAQKYDQVDKNYGELMELPKKNEKEKEVFTDLELKKIFDSADPFKGYIIIMCYCGLRPIEMLNLKPEDIHIMERYMYGGRKTELGKESKIAIPETAVPYLTDFVPWTAGKNGFYDRFHQFLVQEGIRDMTPGCCRHTFVTRLSQVSDNVATIQKAARHTRYQTTLGYTHMKIDDVLAEVNKLS